MQSVERFDAQGRRFRAQPVTTRSKLSEGLKEAFRQLSIEVSRPGK